MPVRQRSPTNNTTLPEDPMAFQTIRGRNPDGSTTVYHVHESVMHGGAGAGGGMYAGDNNSMIYGTQSSAYGTSYGGQFGPHTQHHHPYQHHHQQQQPYIVYAQRQHDSEAESSDDDNDEEATRAISPVQSQRGILRSIPRSCHRTSIPCVLFGILMAISFIVGYVYMVESIVNRARTPSAAQQQHVQQQQQQDISIERTAGKNGSSSRISDNGNHEQPLMEVAQLLNLEPQYFVVNKVLQPVNVAEVPSSPPQSLSTGVVGQPRSMSTATTTTSSTATNHSGTDNDSTTVEQQQQQRLRGVAVQSSQRSEMSRDATTTMKDGSEYPIGKDGPV